MTLEDALRIARANGAVIEPSELLTEGAKEIAEGADIAIYPNQLLAAFRQVEAETIERCAKVCEVEAKYWVPSNSSATASAYDCAKSIRALSSPVEQGRKEER